MFNPDLLDLNFIKQGGPSQTSTVDFASSFVENESLPPTVFYEMCSLLNEEQQKLKFYHEMFSGVAVEQKK